MRARSLALRGFDRRCTAFGYETFLIRRRNGRLPASQLFVCVLLVCPPSPGLLVGPAHLASALWGTERGAQRAGLQSSSDQRADCTVATDRVMLIATGARRCASRGAHHETSWARSRRAVSSQITPLCVCWTDAEHRPHPSSSRLMSSNGVRTRHAAGESAGSSDPFASLRENGGGAPADRLAPPFIAGSAHNPAHHASIRQLPHLDEEFPPSDESVEKQFEKLRAQVTARRAQSNWLLYLGIAVQLATLLWCMYILSSVDKGKACKRPIRGILTGVGVVLMIALVMVRHTHTHSCCCHTERTARAPEGVRAVVHVCVLDFACGRRV